MSREPFDAAGVAGLESSQNAPGTETTTVPAATARRGRRKVYESAAAKRSAHREKVARLDVETTHGIKRTVESLAHDFDTSKNAVANSLLRFALNNRNWRQQGLWGSSGAYASIATKDPLLALARRVAALNRDAGEIGAGMLAQLVDEATAALEHTCGGAQ